jgi:hypothetical protein
MPLSPLTPWIFLGRGTASNAVRTTLVSWSGFYAQLWFEYFISGYNGGAIGRVLPGPSSGLSETGAIFCCNLIEGVTQNTTSVSVPGWPTAVTAGTVRRAGDMWVKNVPAEIKSMTGIGNHSGTVPTVAPIAMKMDGLMNDASNSIQQVELAVYAAITGTAISSTTFNAGTFINAWGRNNN